MKTKRHGLNEREMELVKMPMADCQSTGDIQAKLKRLFAGTIEQCLKPRWMNTSAMRRIRLQETIPETAAMAMLYSSHYRADSGLSPVRTCARRVH